MGKLRSMIASFLVSLALAGSAQAAEFKNFTQATFEQAQAAGTPILVHVHAWWCPTCSKQEAVLKTVANNEAFNDVLVLKLNYDGQKKERRALGASKQSTLIAFNGKAEKGRLLGVTDSARITALLTAATQPVK